MPSQDATSTHKADAVAKVGKGIAGVSRAVTGRHRAAQAAQAAQGHPGRREVPCYKVAGDTPRPYVTPKVRHKASKGTQEGREGRGYSLGILVSSGRHKGAQGVRQAGPSVLVSTQLSWLHKVAYCRALPSWYSCNSQCNLCLPGLAGFM